MQPYLFAPDDVDYLDDTGGGSGLTLADARPYQVQWADQVMSAWAVAPRALGVAATGVGKTWLAVLLGRRVVDGGLDAVVPSNGRGVLFIAHRVNLVEQAAKAFETLMPDTMVEVEQGQMRARGTGEIVVACLPSLKQGRLRGIGKNRIQAVIWDEAHRYGPRNKMLRRVLDFFGPDVRHLGITATPDRGDGVGLSNVFHRVAFEYGIWQAVEDGWLVPPHLAYEMGGDVKLSGVPLDDDGDFDANSLAARMMEAGPLAAVVKSAIKWSNYANGREGRRQCVICCASVDHAKLCAILLNEWHKKAGTGRAAAVYSEDENERKRVYEDYDKGEIRYLTHFDVLTEGWDSDRPKIMVNGRPTTKRWVFAQQAGRILRPSRDVAKQLAKLTDADERKKLIRGSWKPGALIVDVAGTDHKLTVDLASVFHAPDTGAQEIELVRERARERAKDGKPSDPVADFKELRRLREEARAKRWSGVQVDCDTTTRISDPFDVLAVTAGREPTWFRGKRPTEKMNKILLDAGLPPAEVSQMTFWKARSMIKVIIDRSEKGYCSYKMVALLRKYGVDATTMSFEDAGAEIEAIKAAGWKRG